MTRTRSRAVVHGLLATALTIAAGLTVASTTTATALASGPRAAQVGLSVSAASLHFGSRAKLAAVVTPASGATGSVTFAEVASTGPHRGTKVVLGTASLAGGVATLRTAIPDFGAHTVVATYRGNAAYRSVASPGVSVEVTGYSGEVIVREFRSSGSGGALDSYVELYNTGRPVPLAGFLLRTSATDHIVLPATAGTLGTGQSYLVTGSGYSLTRVTPADDSAALRTSNFAGVKVLAPDTAATRTDAVGDALGFHTGRPLATLRGNPRGQWAWVRLENAGIPVNSGSNAADFTLVSTSGALIGGRQSTVGSPAPLATGSGFERNSVLESTLLDPSAADTSNPNFVYDGTTRVLVVRRTIRNTSGVTLRRLVVRITSLSEPNGAPEPGVASQPATPAWLQFINPETATSTVRVSSDREALVHNLSMRFPATSSPGGGLNTTFGIPLAVGGLVNGGSVNVAFTFKVSRGGIYWFGYDVDALAGSAPATTAHTDLPGRQSLSRSGPQTPGLLSDAGARGLLR